MHNEVQESNAGDQASPVETGNITMAELTARRVGQKAPKKEETPDKEPEAKQTEPEKDSSPAKEPAQEGGKEVGHEPNKGNDVLSKEVDLEKMTEGELKELAEKLGSRAVARFGELTAKRKAAEEQLAALRQELASRANTDPLADDKPKENPYAAVKTLEDLKAKTKQVDEVIEWADELLWNNDHKAADDYVTTVDGKEVTKAQVRKALREAQKARKEHLPAQLRELEANEQRKALKAQNEGAMRKELSWLSGDDNDTRRHYQSMMADPLIERALKAVPELEPVLGYVVAHAANSFYERKAISLNDKPAAQIKPPANPNSGASQSENPEGRSNKAETAHRKQFAETGSTQDFIALRTAQLSKRKTL